MVDGLDSERLTLRALALDDVDELVALDSDPEVMRYITGGRPTPRSEVEETVRRSLGHRWVAFDRSSGAFVGWFGLRPSAPEGELELGYRLRREAWGQGLATEGSQAMLTLAFVELGASRVWGQTMTVNAASRRVMERCGLQYVRTFRLDWPEVIEGTEHGDVEYEIRRSNWQTARARAGLDDRIRLVQVAYDRIAETYASWGAGSGGAKAAFTARVRTLVPPGGRILDLGCGTGAQVTGHLADHRQVVGVDISPRSVAIARQQVPAASFIVADMATVAFREQAFDAVIAFFSLIHVPREEHADLLRAATSWLRPGGHLVATMGAGDGGEGTGDFLGTPMYWSNWDADTNLRLIAAAGLEVISAEEHTEDEDGAPVTHLWVVARRH